MPHDWFTFLCDICIEEGKGALQLSMETADDIGADIILANDPDADRLAVAERIPEHYQTCDQGGTCHA